MTKPRFEVAPLGALLEQRPQNGYSPVCPDTPTGKWVLSLAALDGYGFNPSGLKPAPIDDPLVDKLRLEPGDFLISRSNTADKVGRVGVFRGEIEQCSYPDLMMRFRPNPNLVDPDYLELYLKSEAVVSYIQKHATGTSGSMKKINQATVEGIPVVLPSVREQKNIAAIVGDWYRAIETTERLIAAKEQRHRWLLQQLIDHKGARQHWETLTLGDVIQERSERSSVRDEYPVLTSSRRGLFLQSEYFSKQVTSEDNTGYKIMRRGDFTFRSMSDDGRFVFNRLTKYDAGIISPAYGVFYANGVNPEFLVQYLNSSYFAQLLARETQGGTRKALRFTALASMEVDLPGRADQERIAAILEESRHEIDLLQTQLERLRRQKRGLMQKLLTGQWRVPLPDTESTVKEAAPC